MWPRLAGPEMHVRRARAGRNARRHSTAVERTLDDTMLVIADRDRAVAVAGVMGGASSEVSAAPRASRSRAPGSCRRRVRATGRRLGLKTEASARFERGADINAPVVAVASRRWRC